MATYSQSITFSSGSGIKTGSILNLAISGSYNTVVYTCPANTYVRILGARIFGNYTGSSSMSVSLVLENGNWSKTLLSGSGASSNFDTSFPTGSSDSSEIWMLPGDIVRLNASALTWISPPVGNATGVIQVIEYVNA